MKKKQLTWARALLTTIMLAIVFVFWTIGVIFLFGENSEMPFGVFMMCKAGIGPATLYMGHKIFMCTLKFNGIEKEW